MPWDPFEEIRRIQREMDRLFRDLMSGYMSMERFRSYREPTTDVIDAGDKIVVVMELPGVRKEDIDIRVLENRLIVSAERKEEERIEREGYLRKERYFGKFHIEIPLPTRVVPEKTRARYANGVLEIELPKERPEEEKGFRVEIE